MAEPTPAAGALGERRLTTIHAIGQSLAIGPIFSVGLLTGLIAFSAGWNTELSVLLGFIGALALGYTISIYARRYAGAGAVYEYLTHGAHAVVGVLFSGIFLAGYLFLGAGGVFIAIGYFTKAFLETHTPHFNSSFDIPWWVISLAAILIVFLLNHRGVRIAIQGVLALAIISATPIIGLALVIIAKGGADGNTLSMFDPTQTSWNAVFKGILIAVTLFIGFEAAASIGEETREPSKSIPRAVTGTVIIAGLFYLLIVYAISIGFGKAGVPAWVASPSPLGELGTRYVGHWLSWVVDLVIILDMISLAIAFTVSAGRMVFALSRDGLLPRQVGIVSRYETPLGGNLVGLGASLLMLLWAANTSYGDAVGLPNELQAFFITTSVGSYLIELTYVALAIAAFFLIYRIRGSILRTILQMIVAAVALVTPLLAFKGQLDPFPTYPNNRAVFIAIGCIVAAVIWFVVLMATRADRVRLAAQHAAEHHGAPPLDESLTFEDRPVYTD